MMEWNGGGGLELAAGAGICAVRFADARCRRASLRCMRRDMGPVNFQGEGVP
jgi:hypothetical protein